MCTASAGAGLLRSLKQHPRLHQRLYYGLMRAAVPSLSLLAEQSARMLFIFMAWKISLQEVVALPLSATVWALGTGELAAGALLCHGNGDEDATRKPF